MPIKLEQYSSSIHVYEHISSIREETNTLARKGSYVKSITDSLYSSLKQINFGKEIKESESKCKAGRPAGHCTTHLFLEYQRQLDNKIL